MAQTDFGSWSDLRKKIYSDTITKQARDDNFWMSNGFMGNSTDDATRPIQKVTELTKTQRGTQAVLPLVGDLTGLIAGDNPLEGNEATILADSQTIQIDQLRQGVKSKGQMSEQATVIRFRATAQDTLSFWLADTLDELMFLTVQGRAYTVNTDGSTRTVGQHSSLAFASDVVAASTNRIMYAGSATSEATLTATDTMTWDLITQAKSFAKRKRLRPIRQGGKSFYILVMSTEQCRDLEKSTDYKTLTAQALPRGEDNPLFSRAKKVINEIVIYDHQKVYNTLGLSSGSRWGSGSTIHGAQAMLLGAQAMGYASLDDGSPGMNESDNTDYQNRPGLAIRRVCGLLKPQFKSRFDAQSREDYGVVTIKTAAASN